MAGLSTTQTITGAAMKILILTGSIATGKSTVLSQFKRLGVPGLNADAIVHRLLDKGGEAVEQVAAAFPESVVAKGCPAYIDRKKLGQIVFSDAMKLKKLEEILHPLVRKKEMEWLKKQRRLGRKLVVVEIPLFFESRWRQNPSAYGTVITTSASLWTKKQRAFSRANITAEKLRTILKRQWPTPKKKAFSDVVIHTGLGKAFAMRQLKHAIAQI